MRMIKYTRKGDSVFLRTFNEKIIQNPFNTCIGHGAELSETLLRSTML